MKISENGVAFIKRFEGLELEAYQDVAGVWTIGYGHTGPDVRAGLRISERDAEKLLRRDLKSREGAVNRLVSAPLNQNEFDALVSFVYNVGVDAFKGSTARQRLNKGDRPGAADALTWWNKATINGVKREVPGLARRRAAEADLFLAPIDRPAASAARIETSQPIPVEEHLPPRQNRLTSRVAQSATVAGGAGAAVLTADGGAISAKTSERDTTDVPPARSEGEIAVAPTPLLARFIQNNEAQIQFALLVLLAVAALYLLCARIAGWMRKLVP